MPFVIRPGLKTVFSLMSSHLSTSQASICRKSPFNYPLDRNLDSTQLLLLPPSLQDVRWRRSKSKQQTRVYSLNLSIEDLSKRFEDSGTLRQAQVSTWTDFFFSQLRCKHHQGLLSHVSFLSVRESPSILVISVLLRSIPNWPFLSVWSVQPSRVGSSCQPPLQRASSRRAPSPTSCCPRHACTGCTSKKL